MKEIDISVGQFISILGGWTVVLGACAAWGSRLLSERISSAWRREEQTALEAIKHSLSSNRVLLESAVRGGQQGLDASHNLRLTAIQRLWEAVLSLRNDYSGVVFFYNILLPEEYDSAYGKGEALAASIRDMDDEKSVAAMKRIGAVERERPYLGETLWLKFFIYRAFLGRLAYLVIQGKRTGHFDDWRNDKGIRQILSTVLPEKLMQGLLNGNGAEGATAVRRAADELERSVLEEISLILSGKRSATDSFENARELFEAAASMSPRS